MGNEQIGQTTDSSDITTDATEEMPNTTPSQALQGQEHKHFFNFR